MQNERGHRIQVAAQQSGVSAPLIRAWERRYGVLAPKRSPGRFRIYSDADIALLSRLRALTEAGVPISEAARRVDRAAPERSLAPAADWQARILERAHALDQPGVAAVLDEALATLPPLKAMDALLTPLLREVGDRWAANTLSVSEEHLVSQVVLARLHALLCVPQGAPGPRVLLACLPDETHEIGAAAAALRLRQAGARVTLLGARTPVEQLIEAARTLRSPLVALSAIHDPGGRAVLQAVRAVRAKLPRATQLVLGGAAARTHASALHQLGVKLESELDTLLG